MLAILIISGAMCSRHGDEHSTTWRSASQRAEGGPHTVTTESARIAAGVGAAVGVVAPSLPFRVGPVGRVPSGLRDSMATLSTHALYGRDCD